MDAVLRIGWKGTRVKVRKISQKLLLARARVTAVEMMRGGQILDIF